MKQNKRALSLLLVTAFLLVAAPAGHALADDAETPTMRTFSKTALVGNEIQFTREDFTSRIGGDLTLEGIVLAELPDASTGVLKCGSREMLAGEAIVADALDALKFVPTGSGTAAANFSFLPVYNGTVGSELVTVTLTINTRENRPPMAENMEIVTYKNIALTQAFKATDPDGDPLTFKITGKAKRGEVQILDDGMFSFTPYRNKTGSDSFTYVAVDPFGNTSPEAKVSVKIEKPSTKTTYSDMDGHPAYYAALKLCEAEVFTGEKVGSEYFFNPDRTVSRGEFIAMAMAALGQTEITPAVKTGFADDNVTPVWVKPYASAALKEGVIHGVGKSDGRKELQSEREITRAEATVILNNALGMSDASQEVFAGDWEVVPAWAQQAAVNMRAAGVVDAYTDGTMRMEEAVSRADAAEMLLKAMNIKKEIEPKKGLLSWVFG